MKALPRIALLIALIPFLSVPATRSAWDDGFELRVLPRGRLDREYQHHGTTYVEARRGQEYTLRITNPLPCRVAVALSVDGLNSIDADHSDARSAAKWVLGPYETMEIPGWQVSGHEARSFVFTDEEGSYGAWLGQTENLGVIEAVFFRERQPRRKRWSTRNESRKKGALGDSCAPSSEAEGYAATGIGRRRSSEVRWTQLDLEHRAAARIRIRYEYRTQLVRLGVLPERPGRLARREGARGFQGYCPDPWD